MRRRRRHATRTSGPTASIKRGKTRVIADQFGHLLVTSDPKISSVNLGARCQLRKAAVTSNVSREVFVEPVWLFIRCLLSLLKVDISGDVSDASDSDA